MSHTFRQAIRVFDHALQRPVLQQLLPGDMDHLLTEMAKFHRRANAYPNRPPEQKSSPDNAEYLIAAGQRLSSDLTEAIITKLVDTLQSQDEAITRLSRQLRQALSQRRDTMRLLHEAQTLNQLHHAEL